MHCNGVVPVVSTAVFMVDKVEVTGNNAVVTIDSALMLLHSDNAVFTTIYNDTICWWYVKLKSLN